MVLVVAVVIVWPLGGLGPPVIAGVAVADIAAPSLLATAVLRLWGRAAGWDCGWPVVGKKAARGSNYGLAWV